MTSQLLVRPLTMALSGLLCATLGAGVAWAEPAPPAEPQDEATALEATEDEERPAYPHPASVPMVIADFDQPQTQETWEPPERHRWVWDNLTVGRVNPLGAANRFNTGYRLQLFDQPGVLFEQSFLALKVATEITPAYGKLGWRAEVQPLAILNLWAQYSFVGGFGIFNTVKSFDSASADFSDTRLDEEKDTNYAALGEAAVLSALLQAKVSSIAVRDNLQAHMQRMDLEGDDTLFYNSMLDVLHPNGGWVITNDLDLIILSDIGLKLGARYTYTHVFYPDDTAGLDGAGDNSPTHRVGPAILYTFFEDPPGAGWNEPTLLLLVQWWAKHRYRTGRDSAAGIPYLLVGFLQRGDFAP